MSYKESAAFASLEAEITGLPDITEEKSGQITEKLTVFLDSFKSDNCEFQISRMQTLFRDLDQYYRLTPDKALAVCEFMAVVFSGKITDEKREQCVQAATRFLSEKENENLSSSKLLRFFVKYMVPAVYDMNTYKKTRPVLYFMQPRQGLNESFRYLYHKLKKETTWSVSLYELHRDTVTATEYYVNACFFAKDLATASSLFVHESNNLLGYINIRPETKVVQLWHGCGVYKHIGLSTIGKKGFKSAEHYDEFPEYNKYSIVTIASPELKWVFEEFMGIPEDSGIIQPIGVARTDEMFQDGYVDECYEKLYRAIPAARGKKIILYAPTYRGLDPNRVSPDALDIPRFAQALGDDYILIMKHHQTVKQVPEIPEPYCDTFAYDMTRGKGMKINDLMTIADICITDYSSVAFEFSVFERPILFFVFDFEQYVDDRGVYFNFDEITPGPQCRTTDELIEAIRGFEKSFDPTEVHNFRERFMCACDGHASERTIDYVTRNYVEHNGKHPVASKYKFPKAPSCEKGFHFSGWGLCQNQGEAVMWLCNDGKWHREEEIGGSLKKRLYKASGELKQIAAAPEAVTVYVRPEIQKDTLKDQLRKRVYSNKYLKKGWKAFRKFIHK